MILCNMYFTYMKNVLISQTILKSYLKKWNIVWYRLWIYQDTYCIMKYVHSVKLSYSEQDSLGKEDGWVFNLHKKKKNRFPVL